jgi:transposase-like protein
MKETIEPTPDDLTLDAIMQRFNTDEAARAYWESIHWPNGPVCPHCKNSGQETIYKIAANKEKKVREGLHQCGECGKQFTSTIGTIFEDSHIPLRKWLVAFYLNSASKKGISSLQLQRILDLGSYRTALFMQHRIRHALQESTFAKDDKLSGTVEVDETYVGGKTKGTRGGYKGNKTPVVSMLERGGRVRSKVMVKVTGVKLKEFIKDHATPGTVVNTDDNFGYRGLNAHGFEHQVIKHSVKEYVRKEGNRVVTTNGIEGYFSLLKRGVVGTFHKVSEQHLPLYLAEFDHRHNTRTLTDGERTVIALQKTVGKRLHYRQPAA